MQDTHQDRPLLVEVARGDQDQLELEDLLHQSLDGAQWDAEFQMRLASFISRDLTEHPPPPGAQLSHDAARTARNLARDARARRRDLGLPAVRAV